MASAARILGSVFQKASPSLGIFSLISLQKPYTKHSFLRGISPSRFSPTVGGAQRKRRIWTTSPLCMGRRSCKIAGRKDAQNLKKMKRNSRIGKEIVSA
ncbi:probable transcriptional regulatory protein At2g25830 [Phalaenopsis equestris]|uniref:probable transcriptional regulatory protein At2g25830 n=1 Tax=Phalaenopsis equestris TaxID=78828 RepID=UPI0009E2D673|nr:probable transcriptional regulatory protein At2g25830 [Phalaenopsis equestris]